MENKNAFVCECSVVLFVLEWDVFADCSYLCLHRLTDVEGVFNAFNYAMSLFVPGECLLFARLCVFVLKCLCVCVCAHG